MPGETTIRSGSTLEEERVSRPVGRRDVQVGRRKHGPPSRVHPIGPVRLRERIVSHVVKTSR